MYLHCNIANAATSVEWATYEKPLLVAVGVDHYNGNNLEVGRYKAEVKSVGMGRGVTAEIFDVVVSDEELSMSDCISIVRSAYSESYVARSAPAESYKSNVKASYSHFIIGGIENALVITDLIKGQYVHIIPNTYYSKKRNLGNYGNVSGIFSLSKI